MIIVVSELLKMAAASLSNSQTYRKFIWLQLMDSYDHKLTPISAANSTKFLTRFGGYMLKEKSNMK